MADKRAPGQFQLCALDGDVKPRIIPVIADLDKKTGFHMAVF